VPRAHIPARRASVTNAKPETFTGLEFRSKILGKYLGTYSRRDVLSIYKKKQKSTFLTL